MNFRRFAAVAAVLSLVAGPVLAETMVPEGTEFPVRLEDSLSSKTAQDGDRFTISLVEDVTLPDGTVLHAGYRGMGEITHAQKSGMLGKPGQVMVRLNYIKVGDERVRLRATKGAEGRGNTTNQVVGVIFLGVFAAFIKGHSTEIPKGTLITAYVDQDATLATPLPPPPAAI
jgi:hypothetical protein